MDEQDEESYSLCLVTNNKTNSKRKLSAISKNNKKQKKNENVFSDEHRLDEFEDDDEAEDTESSDEFNTSEDDDDESPFVKPKKKKKQQHVYIDETIDDDQIMQDVPSDDNHVAGAESLEQKVTRCLRELRPLENDFDFNEATRIEEDKLLHMLDVMLELWSPSEIHDKNSRMNAIEYIVSRCLGVDPARDPNPCEVHELIETNISAPVFSLRLRLSNEGLLNPEENDNASEILSKLAKIQDLVKFASESYRYSVLATHRARNASFDIPEQWVGLLSYMPREQLQEMKDFEKYLFYILQSLHLKKFRRYKDSVYEPIYTKEGYFTNAWKKHSTIEQYVWQCVDLDTQAHISGFMFSRGVTNPEHAIKILKVFKTSYFPDLEPVRYLSSWRNGIWNLAESKFYPYSSNPLTDVNTDDSNFEEDNDPERITIFKEHIQPEITQHEKNLSIKKNDLRIKSRLEHWKRFSEYAKVAPLGDVRLCLDLLRKADENPQYESTLDASRLQIQHNTKLKQKNKMPNIFIPSKRCSNIYIDDEFIDQSNVPWPQMPTPTFQSILDMQDFDDETCRWIYALLGRALYFCGDMNQENWQIAVLLIGNSGTGKSTILKLLRKFFPAELVGILSNNIERQWAMSSLIDKLVILGYEIKANLRWDQAEFQQCAACEELLICEKHKTAYMRSWNAPIYMAANEMIKAWRDTSGSLQRRLVIIPFQKFVPPHKTNPNLDRELAKEFSVFLQKINSAYQQTTAKFKGKDIWEILPKFLVDANNEAMQSLHPLKHFFAEQTDIIYGPEHYITLGDFQERFKRFCEQYNYSIKRMGWTSDFFGAVFQTMGLSIVKTKKKVNGKDVNGQFVTGMKFTESEITNN